MTASTASRHSMGRLEVTIRFSKMPPYYMMAANGWYTFDIDCEGIVVEATIRPKLWNKLVAAATSRKPWTAVLSGKMGARTKTGFVLQQAGLQVYEKALKPEDGSNDEL